MAGYMGGKTYVPGVGMLGADLGGYVKGDMLARTMKISEDTNARAWNEDARQSDANARAWNADSRAERVLQMGEEDQTWKREDRDRSQMISAGMADAAQSGGYEGVIDYLKTVDPKMAMDFEKGKAGLDKDIMQNEVMKVTSVKDRMQAMAESYGIIGRFGAGILSAEQKDRQGMYQQILPMLKTIVPNAPDQLDAGAVRIFALGMSQALPQNMLFGATQTINKANTESAKAQLDIDTALQKGYTMDSPYVKSLIAVRDKAQNQQQEAHLQQATAELQMNNKQNQQNFDNSEKLNDSLEKGSKDFTTFMGQWTSLKGAWEAWKNNTDNSNAKSMFARQLLKTVSGANSSDTDANEIIHTDGGLQKTILNIEGYMNGKRPSVTPGEMLQFGDFINKVRDLKISKQKSYEQQWIDTATRFKIPVENLRLPSMSVSQAIQETLTPPDKYSNPKPQQGGQKQQAMDPSQAEQILRKNPGAIDYFRQTYNYVPDWYQQQFSNSPSGNLQPYTGQQQQPQGDGQ